MVEDPISSQRQKVQEARKVLESRKQESKERREELSLARERLPERKSQRALRDKRAGLQGRQERRNIKKAEEKISSQKEIINKFDESLRDVESDISQAEAQISDYDERQRAIEQVKKAISKGNVGLLSIYGEGYVKKYARDYIQQESLEKQNQQFLIDNPQVLDAKIDKLLSKGLTQEQAYSRLGLKLENIPKIDVSSKSGDIISYSGLSTQELFTPATKQDLRQTKLSKVSGGIKDFITSGAEGLSITGRIIQDRPSVKNIKTIVAPEIEKTKLAGNVLIDKTTTRVGDFTRSQLENIPKIKDLVKVTDINKRRLQEIDNIKLELSRQDITDKRKLDLITKYRSLGGRVEERNINGNKDYILEDPTIKLNIRGKVREVPIEEFRDKGITGTTFKLFSEAGQESFEQIAEKVIPEKGLYFNADPTLSFNPLAPQSISRRSKITSESVGKGVGLITDLASYTTSVSGDFAESILTGGEFGAPKGALGFIKKRPVDVAVFAGGTLASSIGSLGRAEAKNLLKRIKVIDSGERILLRDIGATNPLRTPKGISNKRAQVGVFGEPSIYSDEVVTIFINGKKTRVLKSKLAALEASNFLKEAVGNEQKLIRARFLLSKAEREVDKRKVLDFIEKQYGKEFTNKLRPKVVKLDTSKIEPSVNFETKYLPSKSTSEFSGKGSYELTSEVSFRNPITTGGASILESRNDANIFSVSRNSTILDEKNKNKTSVTTKNLVRLFDRSLQKPQIDVTTSQKSSLKIDNKLGLSFKQSQSSKQETSQVTILKKLFSRPQESTRKESKSKLRERFPTSPLKVKKKSKIEEVEEIFKVFAREKGKDVEVGRAKTREEAFSLLGEELKSTLKASGFVSKGGEKVKPFSFGSEFRAGKSDPFRVVEKKSRRLRAGTTGKQIQFFRPQKGSRGFI